MTRKRKKEPLIVVGERGPDLVNIHAGWVVANAAPLMGSAAETAEARCGLPPHVWARRAAWNATRRWLRAEMARLKR